MAYQLQLPDHWKIHNVFHTSLLTPYHETPAHGPNFTEPPPEIIDDTLEWEVERILKQRTFGRWKKKQYLIRWKGYSAAHDSWTNAEDMHADDLVTEFEASPLAINAGMHPEHYFHSESSPQPSPPSSPEPDYRYPGQSYTIDELPTPVPEEDYLYRPRRTPSPVEEYHHKAPHARHMVNQSSIGSATDGYETGYNIEGPLNPTITYWTIQYYHRPRTTVPR
jgi:hypothetical protein